MWKLLTGVIAEHVYAYLKTSDLLVPEQKGCTKKFLGTKDQLLIDQLMLGDWKRRNINLAIAWVDYRKAYDTIPHSWIIECLEIFGIEENVKEFL